MDIDLSKTEIARLRRIDDKSISKLLDYYLREKEDVVYQLKESLKKVAKKLSLELDRISERDEADGLLNSEEKEFERVLSLFDKSKKIEDALSETKAAPTKSELPPTEGQVVV